MATAVSTPRVGMKGEQYEQMAREISRASESLYDEDGSNGYSCTAIDLERLWPILNKYIKTDSHAANERTTAENKT